MTGLDWYGDGEIRAALSKDPDLYRKLAEFTVRLDELPRGMFRNQVVSLNLPGWTATFTRDRTKQELLEDEISALKKRVAELEGEL